jgi:hypothetical protein
VKSARRRVLVVGSGARARDSFLPAIFQLDEHLLTIGIWSRTPAHAQLIAERWGIPAFEQLETGLADADTVAMSISTAANPAILKRISIHAERLELLIDTPVLHMSDLPSSRFLKAFKRVIVAEDYMNFPQFQLARTAISSGLIGDVTGVRLAHSGYLYHGLALIRSFYDFEHPRWAFTEAENGDVRKIFRFSRGRTGTIVEPYRQDAGYIVIEGQAGIITDEPLLGWTGKPIHVITPTGSAGFPEGFVVEKFFQAVPRIHRIGCVDDTSVFNSLKTVGLTSVIASLWEANLNCDYSYQSGLYDNFVSEVMRRSPVWVDPASLLHWSRSPKSITLGTH